MLSIVCFGSTALHAASGDTVITIFKNEPIDHPRRVAVSRIDLPDAAESYDHISMRYTLSCPRRGCDPWDRIAVMFIAENELQKPLDDFAYFLYDAPKTEIARIITPYGKGWTWEIDLTDYRHLLTDSAYFVNHLETHMGDGQGFYLDVTITYERGEVDFQPYASHNLWKGAPEYGNPNVPIEYFLHPLEIPMDNSLDFAKARLITTGHGQGNTDHAGEFARKWHQLVVNNDTLTHYLWRDDCHLGPSGIQYGTWQEARAGFCPGDVVIPWDNDISGSVQSGKKVRLDYNVEPYENLCRPDVVPCQCANCDYDGLGHTQPVLVMDGHVIYYRVAPVPSERQFPSNAFAIAFEKGRITVTPNFAQATSLAVSILDVMGRIIYSRQLHGVREKPIEIDLSSSPGIYLLKIESEQHLFRKRIDAR